MKHKHTQPTPCVLALGTFDGMHLGHQAVIDRAVEIARSMGVSARVFTFYENPRSVFGGTVRPLMSPKEKAAAMKARGVDDVHMVHFTKELAGVSPERFALALKRDFGARAVVAGEDYTFGREAKGNVDALKKLGHRFGFQVIVTPTVRIVSASGGDLMKISSSTIRAALDSARSDLARALMEGKEISEEDARFLSAGKEPSAIDG